MYSELTVREIGQRIYFVRGHRVMLDSDLAELYQVETFNMTTNSRPCSRQFVNSWRSGRH